MRWSFYDKIDEIKLGESITAYKTFAADEEFFHDHFPGYPVVPGAVQVEAIAQIAGRLIAITQHHQGHRAAPVIPFVTIVNDTVFKKIITAGQQILLKAQIIKMTRDHATVKGQILLDERVASRTRLGFTIFRCEKPSEMDSLYGVSQEANMEEINESVWNYLRAGKRDFVDEMIEKMSGNCMA